jgi:hypothetical protein
MSAVPFKDFTFIKHRQPKKNAKIEKNFAYWHHELAGFEPPTEQPRNKLIKDRLENSRVLF